MFVSRPRTLEGLRLPFHIAMSNRCFEAATWLYNMQEQISIDGKSKKAD